MRILLIGDIVGRPGRRIVGRALRGLRIEERIDLVIANAENAAGGSGLTPSIYYQLRAAGVDCITMGDHIYKRREIYSVLEKESRIVRPANYPADAPGRTYAIVPSEQNVPVAVISVLGRVFMPPVDCPFRALDCVLGELPASVRCIVVDVHAEATSDKQALGRYLDGRVSAVLGTHTHVPTADEQILPGGTAFQCDVGMTGPYHSVIGRRVDRVLETMRTFRPTHFEVAKEDVRLCGTVVEVNPVTGRARKIYRLVVNETEADRLYHRYPPPSVHAIENTDNDAEDDQTNNAEVPLE